MQSSIQKTCDGADISFVLAPLGKEDGKRCKTEPLRSLLTVVPFEETTKQRLPEGLAKTYLILFYL